MPNYDYECKKCGIFEVFQSMNARPLSSCPTCKGKVKRQIGSGAGIIFKGKGFYATDYRKSCQAQTPSTSPACPKAQQGCDGCQSKG